VRGKNRRTVPAGRATRPNGLLERDLTAPDPINRVAASLRNLSNGVCRPPRT
jgi:hypothetical protein